MQGCKGACKEGGKRVFVDTGMGAGKEGVEPHVRAATSMARTLLSSTLLLFTVALHVEFADAGGSLADLEHLKKAIETATAWADEQPMTNVWRAPNGRGALVRQALPLSAFVAQIVKNLAAHPAPRAFVEKNAPSIFDKGMEP